MNVVYVMSSFGDYQAGCFQVRINTPFLELSKRGHRMEIITLGEYTYDELDDVDIVVYSRHYSKDPFRSLWKHKTDGKKIVYDLDDNIWNIPPLNPAFTTYKEGERNNVNIIGLCRESDLVTTTNEMLAKAIKEETKQENIAILPNAIDLTKFVKRPNRDGLRIGWTGGANHYEDLDIVLDVIKDLQKKYDFEFIIQGLTAGPWDSDAYSTNLLLTRGTVGKEVEAFNKKKMEVYEKLRKLKKFRHIPFYPPEVYPSILVDCDFDIGIIPIMGHKFDESKSIIKYLEYTAVGTTALASNHYPYREKVLRTTKNKYKNWYRELQELIENKELREKLAEEQYKQCFPEYDIKKVADKYEKTYLELLKGR